MSTSGTPWEQPPQQPEFTKTTSTTAKPPPGTSGTGRFMIGEVLGQTFSVIFANIVPFGLLAIMMLSPPYILAYLFAPLVFQGPTGIGMPLAVFGFIIAIFLTSYLLWAALVYGTFQELRGRRASLGDCMSRGLRLIFPVIGVAILVGIATGLGFFLFIIPGLIVMTILWVAIPAAIIERQGVFKSLGRSARLTSGYRWKIFFVAVIFFVIQIVTNLVADMFVSAVSSVGAYFVINLLLTAALTLVSGVITAVSYHQLRLAKEGADINEIAAVFD
jgi:hypothetical protein